MITDKKTLKKIKAKKRKLEKHIAKAKCKSKKHKKKQKKKDKERRRRERKRRKRDESDNDEDEDHKKNSKRVRITEVEDGELIISSSSSSSFESYDVEDVEEDTNDADGSVPMFKAAGRFQGVLEIRVFISLFAYFVLYANVSISIHRHCQEVSTIAENHRTGNTNRSTDRRKSASYHLQGRHVGPRRRS